MAGYLKRRAVERDLYRIVKRHPGFDDFRIERIIKTGPKQITAAAVLSGRRVVLKRTLDQDAGRQVLEAKRELDLVSGYLADGPHRINKCVAVFPELGMIALDFVPGERLDTVIRHADRPTRGALMTLAGDWLRAYAAPRSEVSDGFSPEWWIKQRVAAFSTDRAEKLQRPFDRLLARIRSMAPALRGTRITKAAIHGDFASINAHFHEGTIYGVDVQGRARLPLVQDVAKFLTWTQAQTPLEPPIALDGMTYRHGIAEPDISAFLACGVLPHDEIETVLPFFVGLHMLKCIGDFEADPIALSHTQRMIARFLDVPA